jgi:hypothetical protein
VEAENRRSGAVLAHGDGRAGCLDVVDLHRRPFRPEKLWYPFCDMNITFQDNPASDDE